MNFDFESYLGNAEVWYKSVESNTGSPIFEQEFELFHSVKFLSWILLGNFFVFRHYSYKLFSIVRSTCRVIKVKALFAFQKCLYKNEEVEKRKKKKVTTLGYCMFYRLVKLRLTMEAKGYFLLQQWIHDNYKSFWIARDA